MKLKFPTYNIIKKYSILNMKLSYEFEVEPCFFFKKNTKDIETLFKDIYQKKPVFYTWKGLRFPVFIHNNQKTLFSKDGFISFDIYLNTFLFLSGYLELISKEKDLHERFPYEASLQKKYQFNKIPVVNIYFKLLQFVAQKEGNTFDDKMFKNQIIFSHDIDQFRSGWFENIIFYKNNFSVKSIFEINKNILKKIFKLNDDYFQAMKKMIAIDRKYNVDSISFFIPNKSKMDADFEITKPKFLKLFQETEKHQEIGFHPGYETFRNTNEFALQKKKLEKISKHKITKSRQHFLRYDMGVTPYILQENGIIEDYTLGFAEQYGFRNGIANPFYLFDFKKQKAFHFKSVPLVFMDVSLINYSLDKDFEPVLDFIREMNSNFNCNYSILFHNSVFTEAKYKGFEDFYKRLITICNNL